MTAAGAMDLARGVCIETPNGDLTATIRYASKARVRVRLSGSGEEQTFSTLTREPVGAHLKDGTLPLWRIAPEDAARVRRDWKAFERYPDRRSRTAAQERRRAALESMAEAETYRLRPERRAILQALANAPDATLTRAELLAAYPGHKATSFGYLLHRIHEAGLVENVDLGRWRLTELGRIRLADVSLSPGRALVRQDPVRKIQVNFGPLALASIRRASGPRREALWLRRAMCESACCADDGMGKRRRDRQDGAATQGSITLHVSRHLYDALSVAARGIELSVWARAVARLALGMPATWFRVDGGVERETISVDDRAVRAHGIVPERLVLLRDVARDSGRTRRMVRMQLRRLGAPVYAMAGQPLKMLEKYIAIERGTALELERRCRERREKRNRSSS